ncbi:MAG TPA: hypothetical protein VFF64_14920 [Candidatus Eremiobacteraceae bacterium]|nr:hypothetical protein [Candidatus Eremiobacteraceae bacterium]
MHVLSRSNLRKVVYSAISLLSLAVVVAPMMLTLSQPAYALPAFARKYGLRCSACHESWPMLNYFGQKFKDNGYQLMNDRDAPIWQNPGYWPVTFRITPIWHRVSTGKVAVDVYSGGAATGATTIQRVEQSGFDLSGLDFHTGGTLEKNISFYVLPSSDSTASFHFETVMGRLDNLFGSPWLNVKFGKFELDNLLSEKRILTLTGNGGIYQTYHFSPQGDGNIFGQIGDNQLGLEYLGHSVDDRTRISAALISSQDGNVGLTLGSNSYTGFFTGSQAFDTGKLGVQRVGFYAMVGEAATYFRTSGGVPIPGSGIGNKGFSRVGFVGQFYLGQHFDLQVVTQHGSDNAWFGQGYGNAVNTNGDGGVMCTTPTGCPPNNVPGTTLPATARAPSWNGALFEAHYVYSPQLIFIGRYELEKVSQQATVGTPSNLGNISTYTIGYRYNPFMTSRAGFAWHNEYNWLHQEGTAPDGSNLNTSELLIGFDFDF